MEEKMKKIAEELGAEYLIYSLIESCTDLALTANRAKKEVTHEITRDLLSDMLSTKTNIELIFQACGLSNDLKDLQEEGLKRLYKAVVKEGKR